MQPRSVKQLVRSPNVIVGEIAALTFAGVLGAVAKDWHVFGSLWFAALTGVTAFSLSVVVAEQFRRFRSGWNLQLSAAHFKNAPFRAEFERPATGARINPKIWSEWRLGSAGSLVFHSGLLLVIIAAALRALFGTEAVVDLMEGETLAPAAQAWSAQWPGVLGRPFSLNEPVTLRAVNATRYGGGDLRSLSVALETRRGSETLPATVAVNQDLRVAGRRLFLGSDFGTAALVEWQRTGTEPIREATLLKDSGKGGFGGTASGPANLRAHLFAQVNAAGDHPGAVEVRVMRDNALIFAGELRVGQTQALPGGASLTLHGTPFWARLRGSYDPALWLAYAGMVLAMLGAALTFTVIKCDFCIIITPLGERERVFVALKPQRFAPLFQERFDRLVSELDGKSGPGVSPVSPQAECAVLSAAKPQPKWQGHTRLPSARRTQKRGETAHSKGFANSFATTHSRSVWSAASSAALAEEVATDFGEPPKIPSRMTDSRVYISSAPPVCCDHLDGGLGVARPAGSGAAARVCGWLLPAALLVSGPGCGRISSAEARRLVERYNQVVSEAYRRGDVRLVDPVVGPNEGKKLTGLIGVRLDMGITLDSKLLSLELRGVEQGKDGLHVRTRERWSYRDLKIGTGEQVGEASVDTYEMLYLFKKIDKAWLVDEIQFASTPQVGRKTTTWAADRRMLHGFGNLETNAK